MRAKNLFSVLLVQAWAALALAQTQWPLHDNGLNTVVQWDHYSYTIKGQRLFIWSGEMHYWRTPVPEVWIDILEKVKAAGFNTVSFYGNWAFHSAKDGSLDFESGAHNIERLFDAAKEVGLYILFRPGPYINAEHSAGGFPGWVTTGDYGKLRNNDTAYTNAWTPYMAKISQIIAKHQITNGGNVFLYQVENEFGEQWKDVAKKTPNLVAIDYMEKLQAVVRQNGIDVPLSHNDASQNPKSWSKDFSNEGGNVDNYGFDSYPSCWSCNLTECGDPNQQDFKVSNYYSYFQANAPTQVSFLMEFQGGSYLPWAGPQGGCVNNTGPNWVNVYYRHNIGQKVSAMNVYMAYGGTSWGGIPYPNVGTSYDYSAPISESRFVGAKYSETKLFGQFLRVARDLTKVERTGSSNAYASTTLIYTDELRNVDNDAGFYVTIHSTSWSNDLTKFKLKVTTSKGNLTIPQLEGDITLNGRQSKILVTDFTIGQEKLIYSTAEILTVSLQDNKPVTALWLPSGETGEFYVTGVTTGTLAKGDGCSNLNFHAAAKAGTGVITTYTQGSGSCVVQFENGYRFILLDRAAAYKTWIPSLSIDPYTPDNSTVIVQGPNLVRRVIAGDSTLELKGDWADDTSIEVFAPASYSRLLFNGQEISTTRSSYGSLVGQATKSGNTVSSVLATLPQLQGWKSADSLPERDAAYDDSNWVVADKKTSKNALPPATYPVLYASDYGYHMGNILWRGRFSGTTATGVFISVIGGTSHGWSAYLNGVFLKSWDGSTSITQSSLSLTFPSPSILKAQDNTLLIIQDHMGKDQTSGATNPRGIYNATLLPSGSFSSWKVQGRAGGEANIDPVRGPLNEGGLHAERLGWHLPGFDAGAWSDSASLKVTGTGVTFFRKVAALDLPRGLDVALGFVLGSTKGKILRVQLYVNGYMYGKYIPHIGNQVVFPVLPGILNYHGDNTIGLSVWSLQDTEAEVTLDWTVLGVVDSSFDPGFNADYLRPAWDDRSQYA